MSNQEKKEETKTKEQSATTTPQTEPAAAEAIEQDDEFEEFDPCRWDAHDEEAEDAQQWQDNWDDDDIEDDFTQQLRAELTQNSKN